MFLEFAYPRSDQSKALLANPPDSSSKSPLLLRVLRAIIALSTGTPPLKPQKAGLLMNLKERAQKLKTDLPAVLIALRKKETPFLAKLLAGATLCYALSPIDLIPDFIPVLGYLDDLLILPALMALTVKLIPKELFDRCRVESNGLWANGNPKKWYYTIPIVLFWLLILWLILKPFL